MSSRRHALPPPSHSCTLFALPPSSPLRASTSSIHAFTRSSRDHNAGSCSVEQRPYPRRAPQHRPTLLHPPRQTSLHQHPRTPRTLDDELCPPYFLITNPGFIPKPLPSLHLAGEQQRHLAGVPPPPPVSSQGPSFHLPSFTSLFAETDLRAAVFHRAGRPCLASPLVWLPCFMMLELCRLPTTCYPVSVDSNQL